VQARPETIHSQRNPTTITEYKIEDENRHDKLLLKGIAVGDKIGSGLATILYSMDVRVSDGHEFIPGSIFYRYDRPRLGTYYEKASAIINKGGRTCHAIIAREMGIPAIVGCGNATELIKEGMLLTASCAEGDQGYIYEGDIKYIKLNMI
jgi:pyruvate,water dikinase